MRSTNPVRSGSGESQVLAPATNQGRVGSLADTLRFITAPTNPVNDTMPGGTWLMRNGGIELPSLATNNAMLQIEPEPSQRPSRR